VGLIDLGIDVLHECFRDAQGKTRILAVWDQTVSHPGGGIPYGTLHTEADINGYIQTGTLQRGLTRDLRGHGTHVASIAAGRAVGTFAGGMAPEAKIVAVIAKLSPGQPGDPLSLGYSISHMSALQFIRDQAIKHNFPVVVNVSLGMNAGAHDGTSALEAAFDEFSKGGREPGYVVVKSAGNEHGRDGHARLLVGANSSYAIAWNSPDDYRSEDVVEVWFRSCDDLRFRLVEPKNNQKSDWAGPANPVVDSYFTTGNRYQLAFVRFHADNGDSRLIVTVTPGSAVFGSIARGEWALEIESNDVRSDGRIDAWVERIDSRPIAFTSHQDEEMTLTIPATARTVIAVSAVQKASRFNLNRQSSYGPTRDERAKPDLAAPGEDISAADSGTADGTETMSGTSMAAPHVAGAIALSLSRREKQRTSDPTLKQLSAAQVRAALTQFTQNYTGRWVPGMGFGVLDVEKFIKAFD
jgi:endonuclease G